MSKYIDILLTAGGYLCVAPPWMVKVGDFVGLPSAITGKEEHHEVVSVVTDEVDGDFIKMTEKFINYPLPKITAKYLKSEVEWDEPVQE